MKKYEFTSLIEKKNTIVPQDLAGVKSQPALAQDLLCL